MKPDKSIANHSDRDLSLEDLWKHLGEDPPGKAESLGKVGSGTKARHTKAARTSKARATA